ncbi:hypothetical protein BU25DRAFT_414547 [Macroventuria anomochaeta]|uniref:Uncharacterized protein n=1 Tax=Macroventuria anomochaeta TaxID=301207 RepID=A0ACB6RMY8_9PLEO|nr:uncharacterized protein BU25DRAFT_414547 [Macroventuria anomochaeta]KAF2623291.1 hypothetical protein BU25DRAFT_414547 [Macroventuria anomochaeta]
MLSSDFNINSTWRLVYPTVTMVADTNSSLATERSGGRFEKLETIFAGVSVLTRCVALVVGLFQLSKHRKASWLSI